LTSCHWSSHFLAYGVLPRLQRILLAIMKWHEIPTISWWLWNIFVPRFSKSKHS
jgi:hypothetical protein